MHAGTVRDESKFFLLIEKWNKRLLYLQGLKRHMYSIKKNGAIEFIRCCIQVELLVSVAPSDEN